ncbi:kinase-like domain-containing protein [Lactarius psammicola]|nr:kinase-like domain-containing protein [Lactarius psammicola]
MTVTRLRRPRKNSEEQSVPQKLDFVRVGGRYRVGKLLGSGGSGDVYLGKDIRTSAEVALKIGHADHFPSRLAHEYNVYKATAGCTGISSVFWYGKEGPYEVIVLEHVGTSLGDLFSTRQFNLRKTFLYAPQMLSAIESLHIRHYIHCDIKPENFTVRLDNPTIFLIDFGLARLFRNPATYLHIPYSTDQPVVGTLPFTSINGQRGHAQSRRDNLESLTYTIICLARGDLPWTSISASSDQEAVLQKKLSTTVEELCEGLPVPFSKFVHYVRSLGFDEKPDYQYLHSVLLQCSQTETVRTDKTLLSVRPSVDDRHTPIFSDRV